MTDQPTAPFATLAGEQFVALTTARKSGESASTCVWFAEEGGRLYVTTSREAGKVKRLVNDPTAAVAPSDQMGNVHGAPIAVRGRLLPDADFPTAAGALERKYGEQYRQMTQQMDGARPAGSRVFLEFVPTE